MGKKIKLTETELTRLIEKVISEQSDYAVELGKDDGTTEEDFKKIHYDIIKALGETRSNKPIYTFQELKMIARYLTYRIKRERDGKPNSDYNSMRKALYMDEKVLLPSLELMTAIMDSLKIK